MTGSPAEQLGLLPVLAAHATRPHPGAPPGRAFPLRGVDPDRSDDDLRHLLHRVWDYLSPLVPLRRLTVVPLDASGVPVAARTVTAPGEVPDPDRLVECARQPGGPDEPGPRPVDVGPDGRATTWLVPLLSAGDPLGRLVVHFRVPVPAGAIEPMVLTALSLHLTWALERQEIRASRVEAGRATAAFRALLERGTRARTVEEAGRVLARTAAEAFHAERAGVYLVRPDGVIDQAIGVGVGPEVHAALVTSLVGKQSRDSPVWRATAGQRRPLVVDDRDRSPVRPGGFVQAMQFASYVAIPLLSQDGPRGLVIVGDTSRRRAWSPFERTLADQLALEGGLVVDAVRLRQADQERLRELTYQATHDGLTRLVNREVLHDRLGQLALHRRSDGFALVLLDLDDFKEVNDGLGHHQGDRLLKQVATRLAGLPGVDTAARLGGDEFALVVLGPDAAGRAGAVVRALHEQLQRPFELAERRVHVAASTGIATHPEHATSTSALLRSADVAMYAAKRRGLPSAVYDPSLDAAALDRLVVHSEMHQALAAGELRLHYQPKVDLLTGRTRGVEALLRWQHPQRGLLPPSAFLPVCETTDLVHPLTDWVLRTAVAQWERWRDEGLLLDIAVNVSTLNLRSETFATLVEDVLREVPDVARSLLLEVTETSVMTDLEAVSSLLQRLRARGVRIAMDDFGAGYSSLTQLRALPVDELKIDRMLVTGVGDDLVARAMVRTIVELASHLRLSVVAEGVEDERALQALRSLGCTYAQGYHLSRPLPPEVLRERLLSAAAPPTRPLHRPVAGPARPPVSA